MKHGLFYTIMIFCLINNAYGMESNERISISRENMEHGSAQSIGVYSEGIFYAGLSLNRIRSSTVIQHDNRKTIYPIYLALGFRAPWKLSPYIEAGFDLPEALFDELGDDEDNSLNQTDYFYSAGLEFSATEMFSVSLYAKQYVFKFRETLQAPISRSSPHSYGMGVIIRF